MLTIQDLLRLGPALGELGSPLEMDPLAEDDALQEAQLLDARLDVLAAVAGVIFELRGALHLREANTGVLVARGVRELAWEGARRDTALTAWTVGSSAPRRDRLFSLSLVMWPHPGARLSLVAEGAAFFLGHVPGLPEAPPDYSDGNRASLAQQVAGWDSPMVPVRAAFFDPEPIVT